MRPLKPLHRPNLGLDPPRALERLPTIHIRRLAIICRETLIFNKVLQEVVLLAPAGEDPVAEEFFVVEGDVDDAEAAPVHVYGFRGPALEVGGSDCEEVLAVLSDAVWLLV